MRVFPDAYADRPRLDDVAGEGGKGPGKGGVDRGKPHASLDQASMEAGPGPERSEKRIVQPGLAPSGHDPGPVAGIFGRGTRVKLKAWQAAKGCEAKGREATGRPTADQARTLIAAGREATERDKTRPSTNLRKAVDVERVEAARTLSRLLKRRLSPVAVDENGWTDLHYAAVLNMPEAARVLLDAGADVQARTKNDEKPFVGKTVQALRILKYSVNGSVGIGLISRSAARKYKFASRNLVRKWRSGSGYDYVLYKTATATANGLVRIGLTPLYLASAHNFVKVAAMLIASGADVNIRANNQLTPLHIAAWNNAGATIRELVAGLADVNAKERLAHTPLHYAAMNNARQAAVELIAGHADVNAWNVYMETPLHLAASAGSHEIARLLIARGAKVNVKFRRDIDVEQDTPLHRAVDANSREVVELLLAHGANVNTRDSSERLTPLHTAGHELIQLLVAHGANVNARDGYGKTPLHWATWLPGDEGVKKAKSLIAHGAAINAKNKDGETPLDVALDFDHDAQASLLRRHGGRCNKAC